MKKIAIYVLIGSLLFSGCSLFQKNEVPSEPEAGLEKQIGIVSVLPGELTPGTSSGLSNFNLISDEGNKIFIDSLTVNLRRYDRRRVEVEGNWNEDKTIFYIENISSLGNETQSKTVYENADLGIKFSYPSVWAVKEESNLSGQQRIIITPYEVTEEELNDTDNIRIERSENNRKLSAREWLELDEFFRPKAESDLGIYQESAVSLAQLPAVKKTMPSGSNVEFFVNRDIFIYHFSFISLNESDRDLFQSVFYDIIAGFEFIDFDENTGTTTVSAIETPPSQPRTQTRTETPSAATETPAQQPAQPAQPAQSQNSERQSFIEYINSHINELAYEQSSQGQWRVTRIEFAFPEEKPEEWNAIYVTYANDSQTRKILLSVADKTNPQAMTRAASFEPGESSDWQIREGADVARNSERSVITSNGGEAVTVRSGMRLLEARSFDVKIQYPMSWYWAYQSGGYSFGDQPIEGTNYKVRFLKNPATLPQMTTSGSSSINEGENEITICAQLKANYCLTGEPTMRSTLSVMLQTIQEN